MTSSRIGRLTRVIATALAFAVFASGCGSPMIGNASRTTAASYSNASSAVQSMTEKPSQIADDPITSNSLDVIGVVLPTLDAEYYIRILDGIKKCAAVKNYEIIAIASDKAGGEQKALEALEFQDVKSVIVDPDNIGDEGVMSLKNWCVSAGLLCVMILDDAESYEYKYTPGGSPVVSIPIYTGDIGFSIMNSNEISSGTPDIIDSRLFIIASNPESPATKENIKGLYFDDTGTILNRKKIKILDTGYVDDIQELSPVVNGAFSKYNNIDTFVCIDRNLSYDLLVALNSTGFKGNLVCYSYETTAEKMQAVPLRSKPYTSTHQ
jgi:hypothetical protein